MTLTNVWVASYGYEFNDAISTVHAPTREECMSLLEAEMTEESELWADQESESEEDVDASGAPLVYYGPFFEASFEIED